MFADTADTGEITLDRLPAIRLPRRRPRYPLHRWWIAVGFGTSLFSLAALATVGYVVLDRPPAGDVTALTLRVLSVAIGLGTIFLVIAALIAQLVVTNRRADAREHSDILARVGALADVVIPTLVDRIEDLERGNGRQLAAEAKAAAARLGMRVIRPSPPA